MMTSSSSLYVLCIVLASVPLLLVGECVFEPEQDKWSQNLLRKHMEGSWKFNEELSTALGSPIPYFEEAKFHRNDSLVNSNPYLMEICENCEAQARVRQGSARNGSQGKRPQSLNPSLELTLKLGRHLPPPPPTASLHLANGQ